MIKEYEFKPGEQFNAMTYDGTVYLTPVFRFAYTFSDDNTTLEEYIGFDQVAKIPNPSGNLTTIASGAFKENYTCTEIQIPDTVEKLESGAITDCGALKKIVFKHFPSQYVIDCVEKCDSPAVTLERDGQTFLLGFAEDNVDANVIRLNAKALRAAMTADKLNQ